VGGWGGFEFISAGWDEPAKSIGINSGDAILALHAHFTRQASDKGE
jgi:hypothetical protein